MVVGLGFVERDFRRLPEQAYHEIGIGLRVTTVEPWTDPLGFRHARHVRRRAVLATFRTAYAFEHVDREVRSHFFHCPFEL